MAISLNQRTDLITALVGLFDAAPSSELMTAFVSQIDGGATVDSMVDGWTATGEFTSLYPVWLTNEEFANNFVNNLLGDNVDAATMTLGKDFVLAQINGGATQGAAALTAIRALASVDTADATWGAAAQQLLNKVEVATYFATTQDVTGASFAELRSITSGISADAQSVSDKKVLIDADLDSAMQILTTGQDMLTGSAGNDGFRAWIFDNQNTAQSGDYINGGAGTDTLHAELGNSADFAVSLKTESVEIAHFRAQAQHKDSADNDPTVSGGTDNIDEHSSVDAGDMNGTVQFWSTDSRANLVVEDVQADSHTVTVGWRNADAGKVNYEVYFDNITAPGANTAGSQLFLELLDLDGMRTDGEPLKDNPYVGVQFSLDGTTYTVAADTPVQTTYADLVAGINALLADQGLTNVTAALGSTFSAINSKDGLSYQGTTIVLTNSGPETLEGIGWVVDGVLPPDSNVHTEINNTPPATDTQLTQTDVIFDYVGSGSKAGSFVAGEMSQAGGSNSGTPGIQQFNLDVDRDSWVDEIRSTEDTLEEVFVENIGANGTLRIDKLNEVKVFDASAMQNNVTLTADLDNGVIAKYLDKKDTASALPAADNDTFNYMTGTGDDSVTLSVSQEASAHEDFKLSVATSTGNDTVKVTLDNDNGDLNNANSWYKDQRTQDNVTITTGSGNDTVTTPGTGDAKIIVGEGNDTVYTDNTGAQTTGDGGKAAWVFNASSNDSDDLEGAPLATAWLHDVTVKVTFSGAGGTNAGGGVTTGAAVAGGNGFESAAITIPVQDYVGTQANVNQAIKAAINNDAVLSKLLMAEDGPDNTLIVRSQIDGQFAAADLQVDLTAPTWGSYSAAQQTSLSTAFQAYKQDSAAVLSTSIATELGLVNAGQYVTSALLNSANGSTAIAGDASAASSDNVIELGNGNDVAVLGTNESTDELTASNDIIKFLDGANGTNTIVNFAESGNGIDQLDFTAVLDTKERTSGSNSSESQAVANIAYTDASLEANEVFAVVFSGATATETFAGLTAAELLDALNGDGNYAGLGASTASSVNGAAVFGTLINNVADASQDHMLMVESDTNDGEYKVFKLTSVSDAGANVTLGDFASAELLGTVDFGESVSFTTANFV